MKIEITTHLDRASVERAEELTAAQNRWAAEESSVQRAAPWSIETWIAARLQSWIRADWEREHGLARCDWQEAAERKEYDV